MLYRVLGGLHERQILSTFVRVLEKSGLEQREAGGQNPPRDEYAHEAFASAQGYVVVLRVRGPDPRAAAERCRRVAQIALRRMEESYPVWRFERLGGIDVPRRPASSRTLLRAAVAGGLGLVLGLLAVAAGSRRRP